MKILFLLDELYPNTSANSRIVYRVIDELLKYDDIEIKIMGRPITTEQLKIKEYKGCEVIHQPYLRSESFQIDKKGIYKYKIARIIKYLITPHNYWYKYRRIRYNQMPYDAECIIYINGMIRRKEVDCIIACSMPFYTLDIASWFAKKLLVVFYMMEPYSTLQHARWSNVPKMMQKEAALDDLANKIFAPPLVVKEYADIEPLNRNIDKFIPTEFPNIIKRIINDEFTDDLDKTKCHCFFIGKLYSNVRNPKFLFDIIRLLKNKNITLHCVGGINEDFSSEFVDEYLSGKISNIVYHGEVSPEKADWYAQKADILINIGNKEFNLLPSKLIDYVSMGKPIINISQIENCATLPYMAKYPIGLQLFEEKEITENVLNKFEAFCVKNKGKQLSFEEVSSLYKECTPDYVANLILKTIKGNNIISKDC
ncbi:MAG TPA: glycosyltransferase [Paludibacteraceae bacterium]|nr:glycosyltransferase [Paludibacteraceae bacterium]